MDESKRNRDVYNVYISNTGIEMDGTKTMDG